jgi:DNA ligase (NAD+)
MNLEELQKIRGIGPKVAESIYQWFHDEKNIKFLEELEKEEVIVRIQKSKVGTQKLAGKTFVLTGVLENLNRNEAKERIRELGGDVSESVSKKTNYLVVGSEPGSKYEKAKALGVKIINEKEFLEIIA